MCYNSNFCFFIFYFLQALWQLLWVNPTAHSNSVKLVKNTSAYNGNRVESIKQRVSLVASELLSQVILNLLNFFNLNYSKSYLQVILLQFVVLIANLVTVDSVNIFGLIEYSLVFCLDYASNMQEILFP